MDITLVGAGRAGSSFAAALDLVGHDVRLLHHDELDRVGRRELVVLCVPDDAIAAVARLLAPSRDCVVAHVAGSRSLEVLGAHPRVASMHPLAALPDANVGAQRLVGALFAVSGDALVEAVVASLHGRVVRVPDDQRAAYHAAATVAANHLVALMGHVEVLARSAGLRLEDFVPLARQALDDVASLGAARALTGPASRADMTTIDAHLAAIPPAQRSTYVAMANAAFELAEQRRLAPRV